MASTALMKNYVTTTVNLYKDSLQTPENLTGSFQQEMKQVNRLCLVLNGINHLKAELVFPCLPASSKPSPFPGIRTKHLPVPTSDPGLWGEAEGKCPWLSIKPSLDET